MTASFKRPIDEKCVVLPVYGALIHDYAYEGPCRFGNKDELTHDFDAMAAAEGLKAFNAKLRETLGSP